MLTMSAVLFGIAALGGVFLAFRNERKKKRPMSVSLIHGGLAAAGLILLIIAMLQGATGALALSALVLFIIAALGGFVLFSFHLRGRQLPRGLVYVHGLLAAIAEVLLILAIV